MGGGVVIGIVIVTLCVLAGRGSAGLLVAWDAGAMVSGRLGCVCL